MSGIIGTNSGRVSGTIGSAGSGITTSSSDPEVDTNPSGGVGTVFTNTTSGETYVCTDATTDENVWTNVGDGTGNVEPIPFNQGTQYGYTAGGASRTTTIDRFSFASDGDAADWADTSAARSSTCGQSSATNGYLAGGDSNYYIEKYPFASQTQGAEIGTMSVDAARGTCAGASSETYGYIMGGGIPETNIIEKFSFSSDGDGTDVGNTLAVLRDTAGCSSLTHGYVVGGHPGSTPYLDVIQNFSFSSDGDSEDVGDLTGSIKLSACQNSATHGYQMGGSPSSGVYPTTDAIQRWSFASGTQNAAAVGDTTVGRMGSGSHSSTTHGYQSGGGAGGAGNSIEKFAYGSDSDATDVGDLTVSGNYMSGNQY